MESLQVRTGQISLRILDDSGEERGIFRFNPQDVEVAKRVLDLQGELEIKNKEFEEQVAKCETTEEKVNLLAEMVKYFKGLVDECFGAGTSEIVFGDANTLTMFYDFFEGITPYYEKASQQRMAKYGKKKK